jgi:hypothetical protein
MSPSRVMAAIMNDDFDDFDMIEYVKLKREEREDRKKEIEEVMLHQEKKNISQEKLIQRKIQGCQTGGQTTCLMRGERLVI